MARFKLKQGDTSPALGYALIPTDVLLTGATVYFSMWTKHKELVIDDAVATIVDNGTGDTDGTPTVSYEWEVGDTDDAGLFYGEFKVYYADDTVETFPNGDEYIAIQIGDNV